MTPTEFARRYGPWAIVTGASSGIGRELAIQAAARGLNMVVTGRDAARLQQVAHQLRAAGREVRTVVADLATAQGQAALHAACAGLEVGLLVPAAGFGGGGAFLEGDASEMQEMVALNCACVSDLVLRYAPPMVERRRGGVLLVASILAYQGAPYAAQYAATKAYVQSLGEALAVELKGTGVDVLVTSPGPTATRFAARARMRLGKTMTPEHVAGVSLAALGRSATLLPGGLSKLLHGAFIGWPRGAKVWMMGRIMKGMT
ncbi:MAG: SDR family NAD(P)-dependent oxidoreductase [Ramlibacter sp.]